MIRKLVKTTITLAFLLAFIALALILLPRVYTWFFASGRIYPAGEAPPKRAAIVYGAGLMRDGSPTPVLRDRVATAADLYFSGKVEKLLMSGDNRFENYNEPGAMRSYALRLGVPDEDIVLDYAGHRTYDTCFRASTIFGLEEAVLVTQRFHLPRAIYTCRQLGIDAVGVEADRRVYSQGPYLYWNIREMGATLNALWEIHFERPLPILGEFEPIFQDDETGKEEEI